ncbi:MAG TPA: hypothetical protein VGM82_15630 [Gemmatimonadaceae bacterium]|jgi:hypothetical protein
MTSVRFRFFLLFIGLLAATRASVARAQQSSGPTACDFASGGSLHVDSIAGVGQVAYAGGSVRIVCPSRKITITGDSAERLADHQQVIGHAVYDEPRLHVTSDFLTYFQADERVVAVGNVHARLPNGSTLDGPQAEFRRLVPRVRPRQQVNAIARPTITILDKDSVKKTLDTTTVVANTVFMDGDSLIYAGGQVVITRTDINSTSDSAFIDQTKEMMHFIGHPTLHGKRDRPFTLTGDLIDAYWHDRKLNRILSQANAKAVSDSMTLTSDTLDLRVKNDQLDHAFAWGKSKQSRVLSPSQNMIADSLDVSMPNQRIQLVRALTRAFAEGRPDTTKFVVEKPDTTDWLKGDTIVARFDSLPPRDTTKKNPPVKEITANGHASSLYHLAPSDSGETRAAINYILARIIVVAFSDSQKVSSVTTVDSTAGVYIEPRPDSTRRGGGAGAKVVQPDSIKSIVPLPTRPSMPPTGAPPAATAPAKPPAKPPVKPPMDFIDSPPPTKNRT